MKKRLRPNPLLVALLAAIAIMTAITSSAFVVKWCATPGAREPPPSSSLPPAPPAPVSPPPAAAAITPEITTLEGTDAFRLLVFSVHLAGARLRVLDTQMTRDLVTPLAESAASLLVNGGFFDKENRPEGLVISEGKRISPSSDTLGGGVLAITEGRGAIFPAEGFIPPAAVDFAIQARPRLVVGGSKNLSRDDGRAAERTALCLREGGSTLEIIVARGETPGNGPTLALLSDMLVSRGCTDALNLDGGPSTGVAWRPEGGGDVMALAPRGPLRHAIAIWINPPP